MKLFDDYVKSDLMRIKGKYDGKTFIKTYFTNKNFRFQYAFRLCHQTGIVKIIGKVLWKLNRTRHMINLPLSVEVGYGLLISHEAPIISNGTTKIGNNVNISQFVTIGSNEKHAATIGDNTYIGPNVCIVEDVHIGNNVTIGAGSVVTKDIPDNATAAGNYAKVLNFNNPSRYVNKRWEC